MKVKEAKTIRLSLYVDKKTNEHINILSHKYKKSKNNLIASLIDKEFEKSVNVLDVLSKIKKIKTGKQNIKLDRETINKAVYDE